MHTPTNTTNTVPHLYIPLHILYPDYHMRMQFIRLKTLLHIKRDDTGLSLVPR